MIIHFVDYIKAIDGSLNDTVLPVELQTLQELVTLLEVDMTNVEDALQIIKPEIRFNRRESRVFEELLRKYHLDEFRDFVALFIKYLNYDLGAMEFDLLEKHRFYDEFSHEKEGVESLIKVFEEYIHYHKLSGADMKIFKYNIFITTDTNYQYEIKNGSAVFHIIGSAFRDIVGIDEPHRINTDDWKDIVREKLTEDYSKTIRLDYCQKWITLFNRYCISKGIAIQPEKQPIQNKVARIMVGLLSLTRYDEVDSLPDYKNVISWIKRK